MREGYGNVLTGAFLLIVHIQPFQGGAEHENQISERDCRRKFKPALHVAMHAQINFEIIPDVLDAVPAYFRQFKRPIQPVIARPHDARNSFFLILRVKLIALELIQ